MAPLATKFRDILKTKNKIAEKHAIGMLFPIKSIKNTVFFCGLILSIKMIDLLMLKNLENSRFLKTYF